MASLQEVHAQSYADMPFDQFAQKYHDKFYSDMPFDQFMSKVGGAAPGPAAPKSIAPGDWQGLSGRLDAAVGKELDKGPTSPDMIASVRQRAARDEGLLYGKANAQSGAGLLPEAVGRAADKFALGLPRLAEAYMPSALGGQSAVPGADAHEFLKAADEGRAVQNPGTAMTGNVAGIIGQTLAMPASAAPSLLGRMGVSAAQSAALGAGEKAIETRGDLGETASGGGYGALGGAIGQGVGEKLIQGGRALIDPLRGLAKSGPVGDQATARILLAAKNTGIDDATAASKLAALGPDGFLADVLGKHGESLARSSANLSPEARGLLEGASKERLGGQTDRLVSALQGAGGKTGTTVDDLIAHVGDAARPNINAAYDSARAAGYTMDREPFEGLLSSPKVAGALKQAQAEIRDRIAAYGPDQGSQLAVYDATKKILDRMGWKEGDDVAKALSKKLRDTVDASLPEYGGARALAQALKQQENAVELGVKGAQPSVPGNFSALAQSSKFPEDIATGYATKKINDIVNRRTGQASLDLLTGTKAGREALAAALGAKAEPVLKQVGAERQFVNFDRALSGNSSTARQLAELGMVTGAGAAGGYMTGFDPMQAGSVAGLAMLGKKGAVKIGEALAKRNEAAVAPEVARRLLGDSIPKLVTATGKPITETARRRMVEALLQGGTRAIGFSAGQ